MRSDEDSPVAKLTKKLKNVQLEAARLQRQSTRIQDRVDQLRAQERDIIQGLIREAERNEQASPKRSQRYPSRNRNPYFRIGEQVQVIRPTQGIGSIATVVAVDGNWITVEDDRRTSVRRLAKNLRHLHQDDDRRSASR